MRFSLGLSKMINIKPHSTFQRKGSDVYCKAEISFVQAALGATVEVPTLDGKVNLKIPAGTQSDTIQKVCRCLTRQS